MKDNDVLLLTTDDQNIKNLVGNAIFKWVSSFLWLILKVYRFKYLNYP